MLLTSTKTLEMLENAKGKNVEKDTIDGTKELEIEVSDFDKINELLELMGYNHKVINKIKE